MSNRGFESGWAWWGGARLYPLRYFQRVWAACWDLRVGFLCAVFYAVPKVGAGNFFFLQQLISTFVDWISSSESASSVSVTHELLSGAEFHLFSLVPPPRLTPSHKNLHLLQAATSDPDSDEVALGHRPKFPVPNTPSTLDKQTNWSGALPLPTPEERMKTSSQGVSSCLIPINVTGTSKETLASLLATLAYP